MAYSEGVFDDVNKALLAGIGSGHYADADQVLRAYAQRYLGAAAGSEARWAEWLTQWGVPFQVDTAAAGAAFESLAPNVPPGNWQLRQWEFKLRMMDLNRQIGSGKQWAPERLALVDELWQVREELNRKVWGLGPVRHVLNRHFTPFPWYRDWLSRPRS